MRKEVLKKNHNLWIQNLQFKLKNSRYIVMKYSKNLKAL